MVTIISFILSFIFYVIIMFGAAFLFAFVSMHLLNPTATTEEIFQYWKSLSKKG